MSLPFIRDVASPTEELVCSVAVVMVVVVMVLVMVVRVFPRYSGGVSMVLMWSSRGVTKECSEDYCGDTKKHAGRS
jgi:hypothetical protein